MTGTVKGKSVWTVGEVSEESAEIISKALGVSIFLARILAAKGCSCAKDASKYINGGFNELYNPFLLKDMEKAVARIRLALEQNQKIMIYGDYDVDGVTSVSVLWRYLCEKGADVGYYIPERINEGYGLNTAAIDKFAAEGVKLIITVDSGITAHDEVEYAGSLGIEVVITDHHECREQLPEACAVVNPHRPDSEYPFRELAGVGVVFKLVCALEDNKNISSLCTKYSDVVALGTVADVMPIIGENRIIVKLGLKQLENTKNEGLRALTEQSFSERRNAKRKNLTAASIGFGLAPRINAAGRIGDVNQAVKLLITENRAEAENTAAYMCAVNRQRQLIENNIFEQASEIIENTFDFKNDKIIVLKSDSWHLGVIGIVASKLTERYKLPSILISTDGNTGKGSCRSVKGFNINEALSECKDCLVKYGGHELAAGLTIHTDRIDEFRKKINDFAKRTFDFDAVRDYLNADFEISLADVTVDNATQIASLEPFGLMNPVPMFFIKDVIIAEIFSIGDGKHTKLTLKKGSFTVTALYFGMPEKSFMFAEGDAADFMVNIDLNDFRGTLSVQLLVKDVRRCSAEESEKESKEEMFRLITEQDAGCPAELIPDLKQFRTAYLYFKNLLGIENKPEDIDVWYTAKKISHDYMANISQLTLNIIICVLEETGLASVERKDENSVVMALKKTSGKVNLDSSELLCRLRKGKY